jgi:acetyltransferase-like isoleucine patch superfamily enzyme
MSDVPPNTLVAGNPARKVRSLVARPVAEGQPAPA